MRHLFLAAALSALCACSAKLARPARITLCSQGSCSAVEDAAGRERLLAGVYSLLREAKGRELRLYASDPDGRAPGKEGISFFVQGGPIPGRSTVREVAVPDVRYLDREKAELKAAFRNRRVTYIGIPVLCAQGDGVLSVADGQAVLSYSNLCSWLGIGTGSFALTWSLDYVDLDRGVAAGRWAMRGRGLPLVGGGGGYMLASFREKPAERPAPPPAPKPAAPPLVVEETESVSQAVALKLDTSIDDDGGDRVLDAGERVSLRAAVRNAGAAPAHDVELRLSGEPTLVACFGEGRSLGTIAPADAASAELACRLGSRVPTATVRLKLEAFAGGRRAAAKILTIGMKSALEIEEEVVSETGVDEIPPRSKSASGTNVALVVGVSRYREKAIPGVKYAARDAEVVARYLENVAGVAPENLKLLTDDSVTRSDLEAYVEDWLPRRVGPDSTVFVYYSGHGAPDLGGRESFLVPFEGHPDYPSKLYPLGRLYAALAKLPAKAVIVMLDSCFSGAAGRGIARSGARPLVPQVETISLAPNVAVLAGAAGTQISSDLDRVEHGLFTFFLLKGLRGEADRDRDGVVTLGELFPFVRGGVSERASRELNRDQTPMLLGTGGGPALPVARR